MLLDVVDDEEPVRRLVIETLSGQGLELREAANGEEALAAIADQLPDAVVLDVMMPGMDGFEVCRRVRQEEEVRQPVIVMLTARAGTEFMVAGLAAGADDYVKKPFSPQELRARVQAMLGRR